MCNHMDMRKRNRIKSKISVFVLAMLPFTGSAATIHPSTLEYEWSFNEGSGTTITDDINNISGAIYGASWSNGYSGGGLTFDGIDDYVDVSETNVTGQWTISLWVKRNANTTTSSLLASQNHVIKLEQWNSNHKVGITSLGAKDYSFPYTAPLGVWTHLSFVNSSDGISLYVNGEFNSSLPVSAPLPLSRIGAKLDGGDPLNAEMDDLVVHAKALQPLEIQGIYGSRVFANHLAFDEGNGSSTLEASNGSSLSVASTLWTSGFNQSALEFGEANSSLLLNQSELTGDWTAAMWVKRTKDTSGSALFSSQNHAIKLEQWGSNTHAIGVTQFGVADHSFNYSAPLNTWTHLTFVNNSNGLSLYTDGYLADTLPISIPMPRERIGARSEGVDQLHAILDEVQVLDTAMPAADVAKFYGPTGLYARLAFNEGSGSQVSDSKNQLNGTLNGPAWTDGKQNGGLTFDGSNDHVVLGGSDLSGDWTAAIWVKRLSDQNSSALLSSSNGALKIEQWGSANSNVGFTKFGVADYTFDYSVPLNTWTHLTFVKTDEGITLYADGEAVASRSEVLDLPLDIIGMRGDGADTLHGELDELQIFGRALAASEIHKFFGQKNAAPKIIPSVSEWRGGKGEFKLDENTRIVVDASYASELGDKADAFQSDLFDLLGRHFSVITASSPSAGDIFLSLGANNTALGDEGYTIDIGDAVVVSANHADGTFFGTRSILQMLQVDLGNNSLGKGVITDYPQWENRGLMLDVGRMFMPVDFLRDMVKQMSYFKMNDLQIHINDNVIQFDSSKWQEAQAGFRLESESHPGVTSEQHYTKQEYAELIALAKLYGVTIITEIDAPAHSLAFTQYRPDLRHPDLKEDHLDLGNPDVTTFLEELWGEYASMIEDVHIGTDEYNNGSAADMKTFINHFNGYLKGLGKNPVRMWGSQDTIGGASGVDRDLLVNIWFGGYYDPAQAVNDGYNIINTQDSLLYIVPLAGYYHDYLNTQWLYDNWTPNTFSSVKFDIDHPQVKGGMFAVWNDAFAAGTHYTVDDIQDRVKPAMQTLSQKMWSGKKPVSYTEFQDFMSVIETEGVFED
ncbi:LamG-like jellyroll fold domain-containing protein [Parasalinivibrio latis]|uniref:LamG-like jellyroll fold domain-containing protein n=1 Tax=Parasalinivibrio latis TaxID=2952610 RepID=UPI003DA50579